MAKVKHPYALLGLDIGGMNSRVSLVGITEGKYRLLGSESAPTSLGQDLHIGTGVGQSMQDLQRQTDHLFLKESGGLLMPVDRIGRGVDRIGLVISAGPRLRTAQLGLSSQGSLMAARALVDSLPLRSVASLDLAQVIDETKAIEGLIKAHPDILIITGGEDFGAEAPIGHWIEIVRTVCCLLPPAVQPVILYAGNPAMASAASQRLERIARLHVVTNLQPAYGEYDLVPAQSYLEGEVLLAYHAALNGLDGLIELTGDLHGLTGRASERMLRFLSQTKAHESAEITKTGLLAVDLGGMFTTLSAGKSGKSGTVILDKFPDLGDPERLKAAQAICDWAGEPLTLEEADQFLCNHALIPGWVPETRKALNLSLAFARYRLRQVLQRFSENHSWLDYRPERGLQGHFEPVIASGAVLTQAPDPVGVMLALLDGLQPREITTMVLDRHHLLPLLGKLGETEPVLPVHLLSSSAFENLGTVISVVGTAPRGRSALTAHVETKSGKNFSMEIQFGTLKRLDIPKGEAAVLELVPHRRVDIGFGGQGQGGRLKVVGGILGAVIDARGRPLHLPDQVETRIELLHQWRRMLSADHG